MLSVFSRSLFRGKTAIVTGGGTGIGLAITKELAYLGCNVMIASRNEERLKASASDIRRELNLGDENDVAYARCDIRSREQVRALVSDAKRRFGAIDLLVNNGGGQFAQLLEHMSDKGWRAVVETNLTGTLNCCREVFEQSMREKGGNIVNITVQTHVAYPGFSHSCAARAAVKNLAVNLAVEWAHCNIRINNVTPGVVWSETAERNYGDAIDFKACIPLIPARRLGTLQEVSAAVCFLCSPAAAYISGQDLYVDGGMYIYKPSMFYETPEHEGWPTFPPSKL